MPAEILNGGAVVVALGFDVAHDTDGLLIVTLQFPNGVHSQMQLDGSLLAGLLRSLELETVHDLVGLPFSQIAPALQGSV